MSITFLIVTWKNIELLHWSLGNLRRHYPQARILVISDGEYDLKLPKLCAYHGVDFKLGEHLNNWKLGGLWWIRNLELFFEAPTDLLIKLDPDREVRDTLKSFPKADIFGTVTMLLRERLLIMGILLTGQGWLKW